MGPVRLEDLGEDSFENSTVVRFRNVGIVFAPLGSVRHKACTKSAKIDGGKRDK